MNNPRRRLLTEALGEEWHDYHLGDYTVLSSCSCGLEGFAVREICTKANRTFTSADDYEALREKVIVPNIIEFMTWMYAYDSGLFHWLTLTPEERCEVICDFGIAYLGWEVKE